MPDSAHTVIEKKRSSPVAERPPALDTSELAPSVEAAEVERATPGADLPTRHATLLGDPRLISRFSQQQRVQLVQQLQRGYGNGQVARAIAQSRPAATVDSAPRSTSSPSPIVAAPRPAAETTDAGEVATEPRLQRQKIAAPPSPPPTSRPVIQRSMLDSLLEKAAGWAHEIPGYYLLTVILGKDPIDDKPVERNAVNFIHGVISLLPGGDAIFKNLQDSGAIDQAFQWLQDETGKLGLTWDAIKGALKQLWDSISLTDAVIHPEDTWDKAKGIILPYVGKVKQFALDAGKKLFEFVLEGALKMAGPLAGTIMAAIKKAGDVIDTIAKDPIGFLGNLLKAVKGGFQQFLDNIETHLKKGLVSWLFGSLADAGIKLPTSFDLKGILTLVLEILGLSWQNIRGKLVAAIGEPAVAAVEKTVSLVKTLVTEGIGAAWQQIVQWVQEAAGDLKDMVLGAIKDFVITSVVKTAVTKLVTMFNPVGAVVQAIITIYNTVEFVVDKAKQIADLANAVLDSIASIAAGNISAAASFVEQTLGKAVPVLLGFLADLIGLGGITSKIKEIIDKVRQPIDKALSKLVGWIADKAKAGIAWLKKKGQQAVGAVKQGLGIGQPDQKPAGETDQSAAVKQKAHQMLAARTSQPLSSFDQLQSVSMDVLNQLRAEGLKSLRIEAVSDTKYGIYAEASPETKIDDAEIQGGQGQDNVDVEAVGDVSEMAIEPAPSSDDENGAVQRTSDTASAAGAKAVEVGAEGEATVTAMLLQGTVPGLPKMDVIVNGQFNESGHGMDIYAVRVADDGRLHLYRVEVKWGDNPALEMRNAGVPMGPRWTRYAVDGTMENPDLKSKLMAALRIDPPSDAKLRARLLAGRGAIVAEKRVRGIKLLGRLRKSDRPKVIILK
jgi:hypothetical protein